MNADTLVPMFLLGMVMILIAGLGFNGRGKWAHAFYAAGALHMLPSFVYLWTKVLFG